MSNQSILRGWPLLPVLLLALLLTACTGSGPTDGFAASADATPEAATDRSAADSGATGRPGQSPGAAALAAADAVTAHPRLWVRPSDVERLRARASNSNPLWRDGLAELARRAAADMDAGRVPGDDGGSAKWEEYPAEMYAELFAFLSLVSPDQTARDGYARRARALLMHVIDEAAKGPAEGKPFRDPEFALSDRSRWHGQAFGLTVDWIYPYLSVQDKAAIRRVFLRWAAELRTAHTTDHNHPEPVDTVNDPALVRDPVVVRWSANNYYTAHMRNLGLMAMALDPADDPDGALRGELRNATGAWLYTVDHLLRGDGRGGLAAEGFEYGPQSLGYIAQFMLALHTAGQDDPAVWGRQVVWAGHPFWEEAAPAYLHSVSPAPVVHPELGPVYLPAEYGDAQHYLVPDMIEALGPLGLYDEMTGNTGRLAAVRWIQTHIAPGGAERMTRERVAREYDQFHKALLYFMLFDPAAPAPADPRPGLPLTHFAAGLGRLLARTGWGADASWFTYRLGWMSIDHQTADGNAFEFWRQGEWLTKRRAGYGHGDYEASDNHNTLAIQNDRPRRDPDDPSAMAGARGSQWLYAPAADGRILARAEGDGYLFVAGDATGLYNSEYEGLDDVVHASRSIMWLSPDYIVVYDRAETRSDGRFKRFWLNLPDRATVSGRETSMTTAKGQHLFVTTLLPANAAIGVEQAPKEASGDPADGEPMRYRIKVEARGNPRSVRFLHVLQGADPSAPREPATLITSSGGTAYSGALVHGAAVLFPVDLAATVDEVAYSVPAGTATHYVTGLAPGAGYDVRTRAGGDAVQVSVLPGGASRADSGGVLTFTTR